MNRFLKIVFIFWVIMGSVVPILSWAKEDPAKRAYELLEIGKKREALIFFSKAVKIAPNNIDLIEDYGYLLAGLGKKEEAIKTLKRVTTRDPHRDWAQLQLALLYIDRGQKKKAKVILARLQRSKDDYIANRAKEALESLDERPFWMDLYMFPYYSTRFKTTNWEGNLRIGRKTPYVEPYISFVSTGDTRSREDDIYNENLVGVYAGVRRNLYKGVYLYLQEGYFYRTKKAEDDKRKDIDLQFGVNYYGFWRQTPWFEEVYGDISYYERYYNTIGYVEMRTGVEYLINPISSQYYVTLFGIKDTKDDYYNNLLEGRCGIRLYYKKFPYIWLVAEYIRGYYLGIEGEDPNPYGRWYDDMRLGVLIGTYLEF